MKNPFYREVVCTKALGGKRPLWHARLFSGKSPCGAGNTADNAIKDLAKQIRRGIKEGYMIRSFDDVLLIDLERALPIGFSHRRMT